MYLSSVISCHMILLICVLASLQSYGLHHTQRESSFMQKLRHSKPRCGGLKHASRTRPCHNNDTYCGNWTDRYWHPTECVVQDISGEQARKCVGNRTLAFIGDSQLRDICVGVAFLLLGGTLQSAPSEKFDYKHDMNSNATKIEDFRSWNHNVPGHNFNGHIFPQATVANEFKHEWQVQMWSLYSNQFIGNNQVVDVLNNKMGHENPLLRPIDLAFWSHGLHDYGWWEKPPYGEKYYETMVGQWLRVRESVAVPSVWVSMNNNCREKLRFSVGNIMDKQTTMVEEANVYVNKRTLIEKFPYWDAAAVFRTSSRCNVSDDGLHAKMFVDIMRAKMLFNHLCDKDMKWRGDVHQFVG